MTAIASTPHHSRLKAALWGLSALEGAAALAGLLRQPSERGSALFLGFSPSRLALAAAAAVLTAAFAACSAAELRRPAGWQRLSAAASRWLATPARLFVACAAPFTLVASLVALLALFTLPAPGGPVLPRALFERVGPLAIWGLLAGLQMFALIRIGAGADALRRALTTPLHLAILGAIATAVYVVAVEFYTTATYDIRLRHMQEYIYLPAAAALAWGLTHHFFHDRAWYGRASRIFLLASIGIFTYALYRHTAQWMAWQNTPSKAYWDELANAFLNGRLYLENPATTHDLTFFEGHWYVPNPPLPALVLLPFVAALGPGSINMVVFSILCASLTVVLVYLILEKASALEMIPTGRAANLWLTAALALGSTYWWLGIMGRMWFVSQILTLTGAALAVLFALYRASPWLVGLGLGLAVLSRPNAFTLWPLLAGITLYLQSRHDGRVDWKRFVGWAAQSAVPIGLAAGGLLVYNYARFRDFMDFGYVTITSAEWLTEAVRTYGIFNAHFVPANLHAMFLKLPTLELRGACLAYSPSREGTSILAMTPAVVYALRRVRANWWVAGAWASVIASIGLLLFYHNTGAWQLGYRYLMDFILPVLLLMAVGVGRRPSGVFKGLVALSVLINAAGIVWWFNLWPCG